jgi:hypothetical protein
MLPLLNKVELTEAETLMPRAVEPASVFVIVPELPTVLVAELITNWPTQFPALLSLGVQSALAVMLATLIPTKLIETNR